MSALAAAHCGGSGASGPAPTAQPETALFEGPSFFEQDPATPGAPSGGVTEGLEGLIDGPTPSGPGTPETCLEEQVPVEVVEQPVDIILLLDNSGSMSDELEAVEANINVNFASMLTTSQVDYRVILLSRHREEPRDESEEASTSICVTSPLSDLPDCDEADEPAHSPRFYHYSTKLESTDSFDVLLDTYAPPYEDDEREADYDQAPLGWSEWLRSGAKKVFLEMTDDDEDMPVSDFLAALSALSPEHFGSDPTRPSFVFHSITGVAEKAGAPTEAYLPSEPVQAGTCTGNDNDVQNAGESYQELSRISGGLRFPLCQFGAYDVVFRRIAEDVVQTRIACDFDLPSAPRGRALDLNNVALDYTPEGATATVKFGQAPSLADCQDAAFYIDGERLTLCPSTCATLRADPTASVRVLFTCESQLIVPR